MDDVKWAYAMDFSRMKISADLPKQVIKKETTGQTLPAAAPGGKIIVDRFDAQRFVGDLRFDDFAIVFARDDGDLVPLPDESQHPVPADSGLRTFVRFTCIGRQENLHDRSRKSSARLQTTVPFTLMRSSPIEFRIAGERRNGRGD